MRITKNSNNKLKFLAHLFLVILVCLFVLTTVSVVNADCSCKYCSHATPSTCVSVTVPTSACPCTSQCTTNSNCNHKACVSGTCQSVPGPGPDTCTTNSQCATCPAGQVNPHMGCANRNGVFTCEPIPTCGPNVCSSNAQCVAQASGCSCKYCSHATPSTCELTTIPVAGCPCTSQCTSNSNCNHKECVSGTCQSVPGPGPDTCTLNSQCLVYCGNGYCDLGEGYTTCPEDCGGTGTCDAAAGCYCDAMSTCNSGYVDCGITCPKNNVVGQCCCPVSVATCNTVNHQACEPNYGEDCENCPADCGVCGGCTTGCSASCYCDVVDGCDGCGGTYAPTASTCKGAFGITGTCCCSGSVLGGCGDGTCDEGQGENCDSCPEDCACISPKVCVNGACVDSGSGVSCTSCTQWVDQSCGGWTCTSSQMYQTRTCSPSGCTSLSTRRCVSSSSCTVDPCVGVNCGSCASCSGGNCYNYCSGADTNCGCTNCVNCNNQDGCNGAYYDDYHCSGTSCVLNTHTLNTVCAGLVANVTAVSNFYNKGIPVVLLNISNPFALASGKLTLSVRNEGGVLMGSCSQTISLSNKIFFGTAVKDAHFYPWAESMLSCNSHSCSEKDYYNSGEDYFYEKYPELKILENTPSYLPSSGFVERLLPNCNALFNSLNVGFYDLTAKLEVVT